MTALDIIFTIVGFTAAFGLIFLHFVAISREWYDVVLNWFDDKFGKPAPVCSCGCGK